MAERLTDEQLAALRAAEEAATPVKWCAGGVHPNRCNCNNHRGLHVICTVRPGTVLAKSVVGPVPSDPAIDDAEFIALARNKMPALLDELAALRAENSRLRAACERAASAFDGLTGPADEGGEAAYRRDELRAALKETE